MRQKECYSLLYNPNICISFCIIVSKKQDNNNNDDDNGVSLFTGKTSAASNILALRKWQKVTWQRIFTA